MYLVIILGKVFLFLHKNICCGYSIEAPWQVASNEYPQHMFIWRTGANYPIIITKYSSLTISLNMSTFCTFNLDLCKGKVNPRKVSAGTNHELSVKKHVKHN